MYRACYITSSIGMKLLGIAGVWACINMRCATVLPIFSIVYRPLS